MNATEYRVESRKGCFPCGTDLEAAKALAEKHSGSIWQFNQGTWKPWPLAGDVAVVEPPKTVEPAPLVTPAPSAPEDPYADRHPGMKNPRWIGVPEACAALGRDQRHFIPVVDDEMAGTLGNRLRPLLAAWKITREFRFKVTIKYGGVEVAKRFDSEPQDPPPVVPTEEKQPNDYVPHHPASAKKADMPEQHKCKAISSTTGEQCGRYGAERLNGLCSRHFSMEFGHKLELAGWGGYFCSRCGGMFDQKKEEACPALMTVDQIVAEKESRPEPIASPLIDQFLDLALDFHSSAAGKPEESEQFKLIAAQLNSLADRILFDRKVAGLVRPWADKWRVDSPALEELRGLIAGCVREVLDAKGAAA